MGYATIVEPGKFRVDLDFWIRDTTAILKVKQYDNLKLRVTIFNRGNFVLYNAIDGEPFLRVRRPDKKVLFLQSYEISGNEIKFELDNRFTTISGYAYCDVVFSTQMYIGGSVVNSLRGIPIEEPSAMINYTTSSQPFIIEIVPSPGLNENRVATAIIYNNGHTQVEDIDTAYVDENGILHVSPQNIYYSGQNLGE